VHPLHAATLTVEDAAAAAARYERWFGYERVETALVTPDLARSWGAQATAQARMIVLRPPAPGGSFLRLIEQRREPTYRPLRTYGWAAIEICVRDVDAVAARLVASPFTIIGPPKPLDGWPSIKPMQVEGPDGEIVYLTEIQSCPPGMKLRQAQTLIDSLFILVAAHSDLAGARAWYERRLGLAVGPTQALAYSMLQNSFAMPGAKFELCTAGFGDLTFLELDQYPAAATPRPRFAAHLPPGCAIGTLSVSDLAPLAAHANAAPITPGGTIYGASRALTLSGPDGILIELVETGS
jgi:catechol 2,3-dioxygenase-like lactoylglutathione lyase family enzyme